MDCTAAEIMTARTTINDIVCINIPATESPKEELKKYLFELERGGHVLRVDEVVGHYAGIPRKVLCTQCKLSVRIYIHDVGAGFFSDFPEGTECDGRQLSVMTLCQS